MAAQSSSSRSPAAPEKPEPAQADQEAPYLADQGQPEQTTRTGTGVSLVRLVISLAVVIAFILITVAVLKRFGVGRTAGTSRGDLIDVLSSARLSPQQSVHVIRVAGRYFAVGAGERGITLLAELDDEETVARIEVETDAEPEHGFAGIMQSVLPPGAGRPAALPALLRGMPSGNPLGGLIRGLDHVRRFTARRAGGSQPEESLLSGTTGSSFQAVSRIEGKEMQAK